jgi:hypothetical protein
MVLKRFAGPIVDCVIDVLEHLAENTDTNIDNELVEQIRNYRDVIVSFLVSHVDDITSKKNS